MYTHSLHIKIPVERVGVLIGSEGQVKEGIEKKLGLKIIIDSQTGDVSLVSMGADPSLLLRARDIVLAVGRGFSPEKAIRLLDEDFNLCIIDLREIFRTISDIQRVKSRIIGKNGKTRRILEEETGTRLSIYGHTIGIIGDIEHLYVAREAVQMLIRGSLHSTVYRYLNRKRNDLRKVEMELWKSPPDVTNKVKKKNV
ncbi:MAG: KH domain-containing protein [Candidatus Bathyarchaeota archaeon]